MKTASQHFSPEDRLRVNDCVRAAEAQTSAEIVPVVATSSGSYDRAEDIAGLWVAVGAVMLTSWYWPHTVPEIGSWGGDSSGVRTILLGAVAIVGFLIGVLVCSRWSSLRCLLIPARQKQDQVMASARSRFFDQRVHHTAGGSGVLFYVSLEERIAVVLADQHVLAAIGQSFVDELCQTLTSQLRVSSPGAALCQAIQAAGQRLSTGLPVSTNDQNELPDALVTID